MYNVICMSFDGDYQREHKDFDTIGEAWEYSNDLGSKWHFYPFYFVATKHTIADAPEFLDWTIGRRIKTVARIFEQQSKKPECENMGVEEYMFSF